MNHGNHREMMASLSDRLKPQSKRLVFRLLLSQHVVEESLHPRYVQWLFASYHLILMVSVVKWESLSQRLGQKSLAAAAIGGYFYLFALAAVYAALFFLQKTQLKLRGLMKLGIYMTTAFTYIVYPLVVWITAWVLAQSSQGWRNWKPDSAVFYGLLLLCCCSLLFVVAVFLLRNDIPCKSRLASIDLHTELAVHTVNSLVQVATALDTSEAAGKAVSGVCGLLLVCNVYLVCGRLVFWDHRTNICYAVWQARFFTFRMIALLFSDRFHEHPLLMFLLCQLLFSRVVSNLCCRSLQIDITKPEASKRSILVGAIYMERYTNCSEADLADPVELALKAYYTGQWKRLRFDDCQDSNELKRRIQQRIRLLDIIYGKARADQDPTLLKLIAILESIYVLPFVKSHKNIIARLKEKKGRGLSAEYESYQLSKLFESKLDALYKGKIKDDECLDETIFTLFDYIEFSLDKVGSAGSHVYLDLDRPFATMHDFSSIGCVMEHLFEDQTRIFEYTEEVQKKSGRAIMNLNLKTAGHKQTINSIVSHVTEHNDLDNLYSYFYPMLIFYYSLIKYDIKKADSIFFFYKKKLLRLNQSLNSKGADAFDAHLELDSVSLKINLDADKLGSITEVSMNFFEFFGQGEEVSIRGININQFLPDRFASAHLKRMQKVESYAQLEKHGRVFIHDLKKHIWEVEAVVKVSASIRESVSALSLLTFSGDAGQSLILLDKNLNITSADAFFKPILFEAGLNYEASHVNISIFSSSLATCLQLFQILHKKPSEEQTNFKTTAFKAYLLDSMKSVEQNNRAKGIRYEVDHDSPLAGLFKKKTIIASFEICAVLEQSVIKLYIRTGKKFSSKRFSKKTPTTQNLDSFELLEDEDFESDSEEIEEKRGELEKPPTFKEVTLATHSADPEIMNYKAARIDTLIMPALELITGFIPRMPLDATKSDKIDNQSSLKPSSSSKVNELQETAEVRDAIEIVANFYRSKEEKKARTSTKSWIEKKQSDQKALSILEDKQRETLKVTSDANISRRSSSIDKKNPQTKNLISLNDLGVKLFCSEDQTLGNLQSPGLTSSPVRHRPSQNRLPVDEQLKPAAKFIKKSAKENKSRDNQAKFTTMNQELKIEENDIRVQKDALFDQSTRIRIVNSKNIFSFLNQLVVDCSLRRKEANPGWLVLSQEI